jgi:hypothetical protein
MAQSLEVLAVYRGAGLDFDAGDLAQTVFQDEIDLDVGLRAVVPERQAPPSGKNTLTALTSRLPGLRSQDSMCTTRNSISSSANQNNLHIAVNPGFSPAHALILVVELRQYAGVEFHAFQRGVSGRSVCVHSVLRGRASFPPPVWVDNCSLNWSRNANLRICLW